MTGTEKQIEWANNIQAKFEKVMSLLPEQLNHHVEKHRPRAIAHGDGEAFDATLETVNSRLAERTEEIRTIEDAAWWIENAKDGYLKLFFEDLNSPEAKFLRTPMDRAAHDSYF